jgi:polysaccharide export outer membrane protein
MKRFIGLGLVLGLIIFTAVPFVEAGPTVNGANGRDGETETSKAVPIKSDHVYHDEYILGPGDVLEITTWKDDSLSKVVPILPDGKVHFPLIGEIDAAGKSISALRQEIEERISVYVPEPYVGVTVQQINSMLVYVIGKVNHPGRFVLNANVNVLQVLAMAGGLNSFADGDKIRIIRENGGVQKVLAFNYDQVAKGKELYANILLERGDVIVVP